MLVIPETMMAVRVKPAACVHEIWPLNYGENDRGNKIVAEKKWLAARLLIVLLYKPPSCARPE